MASKKNSTFRLDLLYATKNAQYYSPIAQEKFKRDLISKLRDAHLSTARLDLRSLELTHGVILHQTIAESVQLSQTPEEKQMEEKDFWRLKLNNDLLQRLREHLRLHKRESAAIRKQIFISRFRGVKGASV